MGALNWRSGMKKVGGWIVTALLVAGVFFLDYASDYPDWLAIPEIWECGSERFDGGFRWCP